MCLKDQPARYKMKHKVKNIALIIAFICLSILILTGCPKKPTEPVLMRLSVSQYPEFFDDMNFDGLEHSIRQSLVYLRRTSPDRKFVYGEDTYTTEHLIRTLEDFLFLIQRKPSKEVLQNHIRARYAVYQMIRDNKSEKVKFTGYYEPLLEGSLKKSDLYPYPIYATPNDLLTIDLSLFSSKYEGDKLIGRIVDKKVVPYYDRKDIEMNNVLDGKAEPLVWVNDKVALFFLHIQGSGKIKLDNGQIINVHYNSKNGRPYRSIGKLLIDQGKLTSGGSMQAIRNYLRTHPEEIDDILNYNPSYIFFSIEEDGPLGALNVKLSPGRSIAIDHRIYPLASLSFIETKKPLIDGNGNISDWTYCARFVLNQDTGGAITGPARVDLFWGNGTYAEIAAGHMNQEGYLYLLVLKKD